MSSRWEPARLRLIVAESDSLAGVLRAVGLTVRAGNYQTLHKKLALYGIDTSHFGGQSWVGTRDFIPRLIPMEEILVEGSTYSTNRLRRRLLADGMMLHQCSSCSLSTWLGEPIPLELDHINGVNNDHRLENLRMLCPNCHALTPTWRGRNKKGRSVPEMG